MTESLVYFVLGGYMDQQLQTCSLDVGEEILSESHAFKALYSVSFQSIIQQVLGKWLNLSVPQFSYL